MQHNDKDITIDDVLDELKIILTKRIENKQRVDISILIDNLGTRIVDNIRNG